MGPVPGASSFNSNHFEFVGQEFGPCNYIFLTKMGPWDYLQGLDPSCVKTFTVLSVILLPQVDKVFDYFVTTF